MLAVVEEDVARTTRRFAVKSLSPLPSWIGCRHEAGKGEKEGQSSEDRFPGNAQINDHFIYNLGLKVYIKCVDALAI